MRDYVINSNLISEWDWEKNNESGLYPDKITLGSAKRYGGFVNIVSMNGLLLYVIEVTARAVRNVQSDIKNHHRK